MKASTRGQEGEEGSLRARGGRRTGGGRGAAEGWLPDCPDGCSPPPVRQSHPVLRFRCVNCMVYELCHNKTVKNNRCS